MSQHTECKVPDLRFQGFEEDWQEKRIGQVVSETKRPVVLYDDQLYELVTVKRRNGGVVSRGHLYGHEILVKNYSQLATGDFLISKRQVVHGATGLVPPTLDGAIVSNEYLVAVGNSHISTEFLTLISKRPAMHRKFFLSSYGVDIEKMVLDLEDWRNRTITIPKLDEQGQVGSWFKTLDRRIGLHQRKHDKLVTLKHAMLQRMFPQDGATTPQIRFKGFHGDWKPRTLGSLGNTYSGLSGKTKDDFGHGSGRYVTYMGVFSNTLSDETVTELVEIDAPQNEVQFGDVFFTTSSETPEDVGMSSVWTSQSENVYLNSFCFGFRPTSHVDHRFLAYVLRAPEFRKDISFLAQGISRFNISKRKAMGLELRLPIADEQKMIGIYFQKLDHLITQYAIQLGKLKNIKSACLKKMFV